MRDRGGRRGRVGWIPRVQHVPRDSPVHRMNPLPKLVALVSVTVAVFIIGSTWQLLLVLAVLLALFPVARLRLWEFRAGTRFFMAFSAILMLIHALFVREGEVAARAALGPVEVVVTWGGLELGLRMVVRFLVIVLGSFLFVATTEPNDLAHTLMRAGMPYRAGFALVLALRLMPLVRSESSSVREAQAARGLAIDHKGLRPLLRSIRSTLVPLLVSSMARVDALTVSMEGRAFGIRKERTFVREVPWRTGDSALLALALALPFVVAFARWWWP